MRKLKQRLDKANIKRIFKNLDNRYRLISADCHYCQKGSDGYDLIEKDAKAFYDSKNKEYLIISNDLEHINHCYNAIDLEIIHGVKI